MSYLQTTLLVFDWDGTLFDSMPTKLTNFAQAMAEQQNSSDEVDSIRNIYSELSGIPRREIYDEILRRKGWESQSDYEQFDNMLRTRNLEMLPKCKLFPDAVELLSWLNEKGHPWVVSSSSPDAELQSLSKRALSSAGVALPIDRMGSKPGFSKGIEHVTHIKRKMDSLRKSEILFVGDDTNDFILATKAGVECRIVNRDGKPLSAEIPQIKSLLTLKVGNERTV